jgi:nitroreductase
MNPVIETIMERRSVRFYKDTAVSREAIEEIIRAGNAAPTGSQQSWRFVVVENADFRKRLVDLTKPYYDKWMETAPEAFKAIRARIESVARDPIYYSAPVIIFVIGKGPIAGVDCPMVCENMMLAAKALGLGSCWVYFGQLAKDADEMKSALELAEGENVFGPILIGHPADTLPPRNPKKDPVVKWI